MSAAGAAQAAFRVTRCRSGEYAVRASLTGFPLLEIERSSEDGRWFVTRL